jgi:NAD(P)H-dependent FMN reductase
MAIKCLALACSPRKNGNTAILTRRVLDGCQDAGAETEFLNLVDFHYAPCQACGGCDKTGKCVLKDDVNMIYEKILAADRIILAAPIFSMGLCAQAKMFIDRSQQFWATKYLLKKLVIPGADLRPERRGILISCGGTSFSTLFKGALQVSRYFFKMVEVNLSATLCYDGVDKKGEILEHPVAMEEAYRAGQSLG